MAFEKLMIFIENFVEAEMTSHLFSDKVSCFENKFREVLKSNSIQEKSV